MRDYCCLVELRFSLCWGKMLVVSLSGGSVLMVVSVVVLGLVYFIEIEGKFIESVVLFGRCC